MDKMSKSKATQLAQVLIHQLKLESTKENQDIILDTLQRFGVMERETNKITQCEGQMDIFDYPQYCPDEPMEIER